MHTSSDTKCSCVIESFVIKYLTPIKKYDSVEIVQLQVVSFFIHFHYSHSTEVLL